jgi:hypothetical protein
MKVMKRGLLMLVILLFGVGSVRLASAAPACDSDEFPKNGNYSFSMVGSDVITVHDVPTTAFSGVFKTATAGASFTVTGGTFMLNDDTGLCTGNFSGTGTCQASGVSSGTMNLTLANLVDVTPGGCSTIDSGTPIGALTLYYGLFNSQKGMFLMDIDENTYSVVGEAQAQ